MRVTAHAGVSWKEDQNLEYLRKAGDYTTSQQQMRSLLERKRLFKQLKLFGCKKEKHKEK